MAPQVLVAEAADGVFAPRQNTKESQVLSIKEIESRVGATFLPHRPGDPVERLQARSGVLEFRHVGQVAAIGCSHHFSQSPEAVDGLLHVGELHLGGFVTVFYLSVVLEERDVVGG
ncbi:MAG: hypothetical protein DRQ40_06225, partial [Gammaproteobacteria bacterium]